MSRSLVFIKGLVAGALGTLVGGSASLYLLSRIGVIQFSDSAISSPGEWLHWAYTNLGSSIPVFAILLLAYFVTLGRLRNALENARPINQVVQLDHLTDIWTTLFFGTGVIWTAIGMRSALLHAIGDPAVAAQSGAFAILARLVDGGILTALTTTIVGGIGGYVMRVIKSSYLGTRLSRYYENLEQRHAERVETLLGDIKASLVGQTGGRATTTYELIEDS